MSGLTPRDLKDITDLVSRKLEMYLNIDERERKFDPEGCYRVSPRMHKYDVMYRLLESTEFEKSLKTTSTTPRSRSRNNQSESKTEQTPRSKNQSERRKEQTPRSRSKNNQSEKFKEQTPRSRSRNDKSDIRKEQSQRSRSSKQTEDKLRSRSKSAKTSRGQPSNQAKTRPKSSAPNEINNRSTEQKPTTSKSTQDSFSKRYQYRPIAIKTPRSKNTMVGAKQTRRLELYANEVYDNHPVQELQKIHNVCPRIPNNGKVQNYTKHVGAALNTKNYMDFYLKAGLDGNKTSPRRQPREITYKGSVSPASSNRYSGNSNHSSNSPQFDASRAVVTFKSPPSSGSSEANYKVINVREEKDPHSSSVTSSDDQRRLDDDVTLATEDGDVSVSQQPDDDVIFQRSPRDDDQFQAQVEYSPIFREQPTKGCIDPYAKSPSGTVNSGDRCKSRLGRKSSSLNINYNSDSEDLSFSSSSREQNGEKDTSTRTNSPASTQESLETPSSYQEYDSSESSSSSVLRYYRLSTGEVYVPRRSKSTKAGKASVPIDNGARQRTPRTPRKSPERLMNLEFEDEERSRKSKTTLTPRKSPRETNLLSGEARQRSQGKTLTPRKSPRQKSDTSAQKARPDLDDSASTASNYSSDSPRYTLLRPSSRLLKRSSIRSDSVSEDSSDTPRSSTPFQPQRSHRPKTSVRRSRDKQLIDLNLTAVLNRERSEMSVTGTGDDDVFVDDDAALDTDEFRRASEDSTSFQSRGFCDESEDEIKDAVSIEEYYMLGKIGAMGLPSSVIPDRRFSPVPPIDSPRLLATPRANKENDVTTYSNDETILMPERNVSFNAKESSTDDLETPRGEENTLVPEDDISTNQQNIPNLAEESPKSSESDSSKESQASGSDVEYLSRGSDGYHKDGRGYSRKRSATRRPPSRGNQWEDEWPKGYFSSPKYLLGNDPDERGEYQYLPENRGNSNEKGYSESEPEYYITTEYIPSENTVDPPQSSQEPSGGIPPKFRSKDASAQQKSASPLSNESRGETGSPINPGCLTQSEIYKAISNLQEVAIDFNKDTDPTPSTSEATSPSSEDVKHYNFLVDSDTSPSDVARGEITSSCPATKSEMSVIIKPYKEPSASELETSLVYDMQEKTDEFRGRVDAEEISPEPLDDTENVLGRGISKASSVTSDLSWSDKYGTGPTDKQKDKQSESVPSTTTNHDQKQSEDASNKEDVVSNSGQDAPTTFQRGMLDEDVFKNLKQFYTKREDAEDEPHSKQQRPDLKIEEMMSQLELLVKAKQMYMEKSSINSGEEFSCVRGGDTDAETSSDHVKTEQPAQQYSKMIETLIHSAPQMSSDRGSSSGSITSESDTTTTKGDRLADEPKSVTVTAIVHNEDAKSSSTSSVDATDAADVAVTDTVDAGHLKLHQSSFLETALGISGEVTECVVKPKHERTHLTEKDIVVLKSPCLAVAKADAGQIVDCKTTVPTKKKLNKRVLERGKLETGPRRPRSAAVRSSKPRSSSKKRPSSSVYFSA